MTTCSGENFLELLKRVNYPDITALNASSFDWMFEVQELIPFFETLCFDVQDENILSIEEASQYEEFRANEFIDITLTPENVNFIKFEDDEKEIKEEIVELNNDIEAAKEYMDILEVQRDKLNIHKLELIEESKKLEERKTSIQKEITKTREILPLAIDKVVSVVNKTANQIEELHSLLQRSSDDESSKPAKAVFQMSLDPYLDLESSLLENMNIYLNNSFKKCVIQVNNSFAEDIMGKSFTEVTSKNHQNKLAANAMHLRNVRQVTCELYTKSLFEERKLEAQIQFYNDFLQKSNFNTSMVPLLQLQHKLEKTDKTLEELEKQEKQLLTRLSTVIQEHLNTQYNWIAVLCSKEKLDRYKSYLELLKRPLDILYEQRARLEFLNIAMAIEEKSSDNLKRILQSFMQKLESETNNSQNRLEKYTEQQKEKSTDTIYVHENSILFSLNQIMDVFSNESNHQMAYLTTSDVIEKAKNLKLKEKNTLTEMETVYQEQLQLLKTGEENIAMFEKYIITDQQNLEDHPFLMVDKFNMNIGALTLKLQLFQEGFLKEMRDFDTKKEMITKNNNISLARKLYIYALTNPPKFAKAIKEIRDRVEKCKQKKKTTQNKK